MTSTTLSTAFLDQLEALVPRPGAAHLIAAVVSTTLGHGGQNLGHIYQHAVRNLPSAPATRSHSPLPAQETIPRRKVLREIKEGLVKTACLIGVPRVIEGLLDLSANVEEGAKDDSFVREGLVDRSPEEQRRVGAAGLDRVYKHNISEIYKKMGVDMLDFQWLSKVSTYGTLLAPYDLSPEVSPDPLDRDHALLSVITLSAMVPQRTSREILWHLRGAIRHGMSREEVEVLHAAIEKTCQELGISGVRKGMPRVEEVEPQVNEKH